MKQQTKYFTGETYVPMCQLSSVGMIQNNYVANSYSTFQSFLKTRGWQHNSAEIPISECRVGKIISMRENTHIKLTLFNRIKWLAVPHYAFKSTKQPNEITVYRSYSQNITDWIYIKVILKQPDYREITWLELNI